MVYVFVSCHTLTWKHKHLPIKEDVEPLPLPEDPEFANDSFMYSSQQSLVAKVIIIILLTLAVWAEGYST